MTTSPLDYADARRNQRLIIHRDGDELVIEIPPNGLWLQSKDLLIGIAIFAAGITLVLLWVWWQYLMPRGIALGTFSRGVVRVSFSAAINPFMLAGVVIMLVMLFLFAGTGRIIRVTSTNVTFSSYLTLFARHWWERHDTIARDQIHDVRSQWVRPWVVVKSKSDRLLADVRLPDRSDRQRLVQVLRVELGFKQID